MAALSVACFVGACQSSGNARAVAIDSEELGQMLKPGRTTQEDVSREFGTAIVYRFASGYETWTYKVSAEQPRFLSRVPTPGLLALISEDRTAELALLFSPDGVLRKIDRRSRPVGGNQVTSSPPASQ